MATEQARILFIRLFNKGKKDKTVVNPTWKDGQPVENRMITFKSGERWAFWSMHIEDPKNNLYTWAHDTQYVLKSVHEECVPVELIGFRDSLEPHRNIVRAIQPLMRAYKPIAEQLIAEGVIDTSKIKGPDWYEQKKADAEKPKRRSRLASKAGNGSQKKAGSSRSKPSGDEKIHGGASGEARPEDELVSISDGTVGIVESSTAVAPEIT